MIDGFTERARRVGALLSDPATTFLIVTAPRHDPVEEAIYFHRKLREAGMPFGGLVVNRVHQPPEDRLPAAVAADLGPALAERVTVATAELAALATRDAANVERLRERLGDPPTIIVPELAGRRPRPRGPGSGALAPVRGLNSKHRGRCRTPQLSAQWGATVRPLRSGGGEVPATSTAGYRQTADDDPRQLPLPRCLLFRP